MLYGIYGEVADRIPMDATLYCPSTHPHPFLIDALFNHRNIY